MQGSALPRLAGGGKRERPLVERDEGAEPEEYPLLVDDARLITIHTEVSGAAQPAVIDSGSSLNIMSDDTARKHRLKVAPCRRPVFLRMADGSRAAPEGETVVDFTINGEPFQAECVILKGFPYEFLLGLHFILTAPVDIMPSQRVIRIGEGSVSIPFADIAFRLTSEPIALYAACEQVVPPRSEAIVKLKSDCLPASVVLVEPAPSAATPMVLLAASASTVMPSRHQSRRSNRLNSHVWARVLNPNTEAITLRRNALLATASPIADQDLFVVDSACSTNSASDPAPPPPAAEAVPFQELVVNPDLSAEQREQLAEMLREVGMDVFSANEFDLGRTDIVKHVIDTGTAPPVRRPPYRKSFQERSALNQIVKKYEEHGIVRKSMSPYAAPVVLVRKKDGSVRFCCDWRELNRVTKKDSMPLPRVDDTLDRLAGSAWFTTADFTAGYFQVELDEGSKEKTAFITPDGLWEFNVLGMGLCNAPATFMRLMHHVLGDLMWTVCMAYLDDVVIFSKTYDEHLKDVEAVFSAIRRAGLKLKAKKCAFAMQKIEFLGHIVSQEGIAPDPAKLEAVANFPPPADVKQIQQFLGLAGYYRRFIKNFSAIAKPLTQLLRKGVFFDMTAECLSAFEALRDALVAPPVLAHPDFARPFIVTTDASGFAVGAVLKQKDDEGKARPIAYFSQCLNKAEQNYSATERECLAVILAVKKFRPYLFGARFTIVTDHCSLCWLMTVRNPNGRLVRWSLQLQDLDFEIVYENGRKHLEADALSRAPVDPAPERATEPLFACDEGAEVSVRDLQHRLDWLQPIRLCLLDPDGRHDRKTKRRARKYLLENGLVFRRTHDESSGGALVLPPELRQHVLHSLHDHVTAGHLGIAKTYHKIKQRFYWPRMYRDIRSYVLSCKKCGGNKICTQAQMGMLQPIPPTCRPFERLGMDELGPFQQSIDGNQRVIVLTDYATRMVFARAVPNGSAYEVAKFLVEDILLKHGTPKEILTDRGREFVNETFRLIGSAFGFEHLKSTAYHPRTNGLTERFNGTLARMLSAYTADHKDWDRFLPYLVFAYNTSVHDVTGYSPYFLLHGLEPRLGIEAELDDGRITCDQFAFENVHYARLAREIAAAETSRSQDQAKARFDATRRDHQFAPGDDVWIRRLRRQIGRTEKLLPAYLGPFRLIRQTAPNDFEVEDADGHRDVVNVERFKRFYLRSDGLDPPPAEVPDSLRQSPPASGETPADIATRNDAADGLPAFLRGLHLRRDHSSDQRHDQSAYDSDGCDSLDGVAGTFLDENMQQPPSDSQSSCPPEQSDALQTPPAHSPQPTTGTQTRYGRWSLPPSWVQRCAPSTL